MGVIPFEAISHGSARKKVFIQKATNSGLTQFAYSEFLPGEKCETHIHRTMDEYFFIISGNGLYCIGNEELNIVSGDFIKIPAKTRHMVSNISKDNLKMIYFGIVVNE